MSADRDGAALVDPITIPITLTLPFASNQPQSGFRFPNAVPPFRGWQRKQNSAADSTPSEPKRPSLPHLRLVQFDREDPAVRPGVAAELEELRAAADGRPLLPRLVPKFSPTEVQDLRAFFGKRPEDAKELVERLRSSGKISLPPGVTKELLERYGKIAESAISRGIDKIETQKWRLEAIQLILKDLP